ncbi:MAG TPA: inositol monophosphatase family protein [Mycolicibacterium fallax]|nr:inositol monophosphatase family protein [Mycolicibacterium fallax]
MGAPEVGYFHPKWRLDDGVDALREVAEAVATEAAEFVALRRREVFDGAGPAADGDAVRAKSTPTDPVTVVDTETEALLRRRLAELRPGDALLGEEGGATAAAEAGPDTVTWVLDPIDGTVNFVYGIPAYAVSVAAQIGGVSVAGAVADVAGGALYSAARGAGAHLRDAHGRRRLRCRGPEQSGQLALALVGTGFGYAPERRAAQAGLLAGLLPQVRDIRRIGSAALDLCQLAAGRLDAYYEHGLNVWDWAAGALIAAEAGARVWLAPPEQGGAGLTAAAAPGVADEFWTALGALGAHPPLR